jgi:hypothetical protein
VGEIGISRREFLYDLNYTDLLLIEYGYEKRRRDLWSAVRWQTYYTMAAQVGRDNMKKSGLYSPTDLLLFPWDNEGSGDTGSAPISSKEVERMQQLMREENARLAKK